ncbi:MAG: hypothetical protein JRF33_12100 [Deltaproteobacteria bacterium]|nr:hypothetical protein [Deltaproteobacteria bacterium]
MDSRLGGTLEDEFDLGFDHVDAYWINQDLILAYERDYKSIRVGENLQNQVVRMVFLTDRRSLEESENIFFAGTDEPKALLLDHYVISESSFGVLDQEPNFPPYLEVRVFFKELGMAAGEKISGDFRGTLEGDQILWGDFEARLRDP